MIPKIIHYCWFGGAPLPELAEWCIASWRRYMPDWQYMRWDEDSLTRVLQEPNPGPCPKGKGEKYNWLAYMPAYVREAYEARKYAFVSDYVRLWALERFGGLYMDIDFEVFRPFDDLMDRYPAFAGYEGSKRQPVMQGVIASEPHGTWVSDMLSTYEGRKFIKPDGSLNLTPNTGYFTDRLESQGFVADGIEKDLFAVILPDASIQLSTFHIPHSTLYLHVFPVDYFCPVMTTGEDVRTERTYCEHRGLHSWNSSEGWKVRLLNLFGPKMRTCIIKLKRKILG